MKIVDLHCDTISRLFKNGESLLSNSGQYDIKRAIEGGICLQYFALFTMPDNSDAALRKMLLMINYYHTALETYDDYLSPVYSYGDLISALDQNKIGCMLHMEGAASLADNVEILDLFYRLGLRSLGLTWNHRNLLADGVGEDPEGGGLSKAGKRVVKKLEELGMVLDLAHISEKGFYDAIEIYHKPVFVTHANARALCPHKRNLTDRQLQVLAENRGLVGVTQVNDFVSEGDASIEKMLDHICYIADLIGVKHIALGSDFDGADDMVISDVSGYSKMEALLSGRGFSAEEIRGILSGNALAAMQVVLS